MRNLDLRATIRTRHRPQRRHRLRRAERQIHAGDPRPVAADATDRLAGPRRTTVHQRDQLRTADRLLGVEAELVERVRRPVPRPALPLQLAADVVVAATRRRRQVRREPSRRRTRNLVSRLHTTERRSGRENAQEQPKLSEPQRTSAHLRGAALTIGRPFRDRRPARSAYRLHWLLAVRAAGAQLYQRLSRRSFRR